MKKYENFCAALQNMKDIVNKTKNEFYDMFCALKEEIEKTWL